MKFNSPHLAAAGILLVVCSCLLLGCNSELQRGWSYDVVFTQKASVSSAPTMPASQKED